MNVSGPAVIISKETANQHPFTSGIKDTNVNKTKYAHNSTENPGNLKKNKEKTIPGVSRTQFTVIGDRVTKEFIYCSNVVKDLYKHRKNVFEAPVLRGVTTIEWPKIWNDLKIKYKKAHCQTSSVAVLINDKFLGGEVELKKCVLTKFRYTLHINYHKDSIAEFARFFRGSGRPFAYMNIEIDKTSIGSFIFMLYADIVPRTCDNFLRLCKETKGGYAGTPIHRVVKDGWIQAGGYGLKETDLECENFTIPHDRRGLLCMANSGLHTECSTQFFILLQPAPWMANKFVAFGQLVEGKNTLETIEAVPTWRESPVSSISILRSGILNIECDDIMINKGTNEYIAKHIEDLNELGELLYEELLEKVLILAHLRELERLRQMDEEGGESKGDAYAGLHTTARFNRRKEDIEMDIQKIKAESQMPTTVIFSKQTTSQRPASASVNENNDFDVESYDPEYEETEYQHQSIQVAPSLVKERKPFYIPLTDVLYPGEKDSEFDLKRFLQGDYCLECDLIEPAKNFVPYKEKVSYASEVFHDDDNTFDSDKKANTGEDMKIYLREYADQVSFAGDVVEDIGKCKGNLNIFDQVRQYPNLITDDQLRRLRLASIDMRFRDKPDSNKKVEICMPEPDLEHRTKINRRATGFTRPEDYTKIGIYNSIQNDKDVEDDSDADTDDDSDVIVGGRKVRIVSSSTKEFVPVERQLTSFALPTLDDDDAHDTKHSVLATLFGEMKEDSEPPTLKDYGLLSKTPEKEYLMLSSAYRFKNDLRSGREKYQHKTVVVSDTFKQVLTLQHGKTLTRKLSSDYVMTIGDIENKVENSIRSIEYAKMRPSITVSQYQKINRLNGKAKRS